MATTPAEDLRAAKALLCRAGYKSVNKRAGVESFEAPTSTVDVQHMVSLALDRGLGTEIEIYIGLRNEELEQFARQCLIDYASRPEWNVEPTSFSYFGLNGLAGPGQMYLRIDTEGRSVDETASEVLETLRAKFEPEFSKIGTKQEYFDCLVNPTGIWTWGGADSAAWVAQMFALGAQLSRPKEELTKLIQPRLEFLGNGLPPGFSAKAYVEAVADAADRLRPN